MLNGPITFNFRGTVREGKVLVKDDRWYVYFPYSKLLVPEIKAMSGARFNKEPPYWHVDINQHNQFQFDYLQGKNPYARYDAELEVVERFRQPIHNRLKQISITPYLHQQEMASHIWTRRMCIIAAEMGTGKTLSTILAMEEAAERFGWDRGGLDSSPDFWYVAPKSVLNTIRRELWAWNSSIVPTLMTYDELRKVMGSWTPGRKAPRFVTFDESSMIKSPTSQRSQAAAGLADGMRHDHGDECFVVLLTGTPAPKSPEDWWHQCRVARPGFVKEGDHGKFRRRLGIMKVETNFATSQQFSKLLGWKDSDDKCEVCGKKSDDPSHLIGFDKDTHQFKPCVNEVALLYERMRGLVYIKFKKDCLDLPEKIYRTIEIKPTKELLRTASLIAKTAKSTIEGLTRLRELSDGFQYYDKVTGQKDCPDCSGTGQGDDFEEIDDSCPNCNKSGSEVQGGGEATEGATCLNHVPEYKKITGKCHRCSGKGKIDVVERLAKRVPCAKDDVLKDLLEENDDIGRLVVFAGFTESVDRVCDISQAAGWATIRCDGRGWLIRDADGFEQSLDPLAVFQDRNEGQLGATFPKVVFVAHPGSGGFSHTLTSACMSYFHSNDFRGDYRSQAEDRIHRIGMDPNKGATIVDVIHLPSDLKVLENLKAKRNLELMSLGEVAKALESSSEERKT